MAFSLKSLFHPGEDVLRACRLYGAVVEQARRPEFYARLGVPDTPEGRFSLVALHAFLVMERLAHDPAGGGPAQALFDAMFADIDRNLREMGVGDLSVGKKVKRLAQHFYGMADAVRAGLRADRAVLEAALRRNVYGPAPAEAGAVQMLAEYVRDAVAALDRQPVPDLIGGHVRFGALPDGDG